ncbi:Hypothetical predicted protein [Podarcis lilfordi]|uniref:Uncharacterized protein n=1 Tax=Podarcis lilfordi TaxID=74358 RepID=A0AA35K3G2_9SAUR|nr:Hypothetical predicted protein [Podarcis lilfordi]
MHIFAPTVWACTAATVDLEAVRRALQDDSFAQAKMAEAHRGTAATDEFQLRDGLLIHYTLCLMNAMNGREIEPNRTLPALKEAQRALCQSGSSGQGEKGNPAEEIAALLPGNSRLKKKEKGEYAAWRSGKL